jgi:hypothetical protein
MSLLITGNAAKRAAAAAVASNTVASNTVASNTVASNTGASSAAASSAAARPVTVPVAPLDDPPPIPRVKVHATPGEHPLLEFSHPALGLVGLGFWFVFVGTRHQPMAWVAFGVLVTTIGAGLSWLAHNTLAARKGGPAPRPAFPARLVILHGVTAAGTFILAVLTALAASHP